MTTRSKLIVKLAGQYSNLTVSDVELVVRTLIESIAKHLAHGGRVEIRGFGSFSVHTRSARLGHNPRTGVKVQVPERHVPHFKPGVELRERVNIGSWEQQENQSA